MGFIGWMETRTMRSLQIAVIICLFNTGCTDHTIIREEETPAWSVFTKMNSPLPNDQVQAIAIDKKDVKWIGTADGLATLAGNSWNIYNTVNSPLPSNFITALAVGKESDVWIGTDKGLINYNGASWSVPDKLKGEFVTRLLFDEKSGVLWVGTERGLFRYDGNQWEGYNDAGSALLDLYVSSMAVDRNGTLWVGTFDHFSFIGRLLKFDGSKWTSERLDHRDLPSSFPDALLIDENDIAWLGVKGTMGGMLIRIQDDKWEIYNRLNTGCQGMGGGMNSLAITGNTKWIASGSGLIEYDETSWNYYDTRNSGLPDDYVYTIAIDHEGTKWIGTISGGLAVFK